MAQSVITRGNVWWIEDVRMVVNAELWMLGVSVERGRRAKLRLEVWRRPTGMNVVESVMVAESVVEMRGRNLVAVCGRTEKG
jgi:hypothetical protein